MPADRHEPADRLAAILELSDDAIVTATLSGVVTSWSPAAERLFGRDAAHAVDRPLRALFPKDDAVDAEAVARAGRGERVARAARVWIHGDGSRIDVGVSLAPLRAGDGTIVGVSAIARDLRPQRARENEVSRLSRLYAVLSHVNQTIARTHTRDDLLRGSCRVLVEAGFRMAWIGWRASGSTLLVPVAVSGDDTDYLRGVEIDTDASRAEGRGPAGTAFREGRPCICNDTLADAAMQPWHGELAPRSLRAAAVFPIRMGAEVRGTLTVYASETDFFQDKEVALLSEAAADISDALDNLERAEEHRLAEAAARTERLFSQAMIESMPGVVYSYDSNGRFLRWNRNFESVSGYSSAEIARMHPSDFFAEAEKGRLAAAIEEVFAKGESSIEAPFLARDGTSTPYFFTGKRLVLDGTVCLVGVGIDVSERKRAETALQLLNETLEVKVAERTRELQEALLRAEAADTLKSAFLATMSHELRTPLNSIIGFTGVLVQGLAGPLNAEQAKQLGMVQVSARHLLALINDVLDLSKIEAGQLEIRSEPFDVRASLDRVMALVKPHADKKGLVLRLHAPGPLGGVVSDRRRLEQILLNLLSNAIKFTETGTVTLSADVKGGVVRMEVADTGIGIRPADLGTMFQPFRQLDAGLARQHEGTGLGLTICRRLATLLGGEITATSEWGRGSTFTVTLPVERAGP